MGWGAVMMRILYNFIMRYRDTGYGYRVIDMVKGIMYL